MDALLPQITTGEQQELVVFNPLAHPRSDLVTTREKLFGLIDPATGAAVPLQTLADGRTVFHARDVPAYGYKTYKIAAAATPAAGATAPGPGAAQRPARRSQG
ncbi:MAG: hypothetical protein V4773_02250, partial [Verrucomicrobiota bacterium]